MSASLQDLQTRFLNAMTGTVASAPMTLLDEARYDGLSIYADAYLTRLVECLAASFPVLARAIGDEAFAALAVDYLRAVPPSSPNLADLGGRFADHLAATRPEDSGDSGHWGAFLVDLARFERALEEVFDGPGAEGGAALAPEALSALSPEAWASARLVCNPALRLLDFGFPVDDFWGSVRGLDEGTTPPSPPAASEQFVALCRREHVVRRLVLEPKEHAWLAGLAQGQSVGAAVAALVGHLDESALERWFARWMTEGLFVGLEAC